MCPMIEKQNQNLCPPSSQSFPELWILMLGAMLEKACPEESAEAHSPANQEQPGSYKVADSKPALEVVRPLDVETRDPPDIYNRIHQLQEISSLRLHRARISSRLIFESFRLLAFKLAVAYQQPTFQSHRCQRQLELTDKSCASKGEQLVVRGTQLVVTYSLQHIQNLLSENNLLDPTKGAHTKWAILEKQMQKRLIGTAFRVMKGSQRAKSLFKHVSRKKFLRQLPYFSLMLTNCHQFAY